MRFSVFEDQLNVYLCPSPAFVFKQCRILVNVQQVFAYKVESCCQMRFVQEEVGKITGDRLEERSERYCVQRPCPFKLNQNRLNSV